MTASSKGKTEQPLDEWVEEQVASLRRWVQEHRTDKTDAERIQTELPSIDRERTTAQIVPKVKTHPKGGG